MDKYILDVKHIYNQPLSLILSSVNSVRHIYRMVDISLFDIKTYLSKNDLYLNFGLSSSFLFDDTRLKVSPTSLGELDL